jgi:hypothetical protein
MNLSEIHDGYIPDLVLLDVEASEQARAAQVSHLLPDQVEMVVEVTLRSNASDDRQPTLRRATGTK